MSWPTTILKDFLHVFASLGHLQIDVKVLVEMQLNQVLVVVLIVEQLVVEELVVEELLVEVLVVEELQVRVVHVRERVSRPTCRRPPPPNYRTPDE